VLPAEDLARLAEACLEADGGLPLAAEPPFLEARWGADGATTRFDRDDDGRLVAAAVVRPGPAGSSPPSPPARAAILVHPSARDREAGLLDWALGVAPGATVETESLTAERERLYGSRGLRRVFAEDVLSRDLTTGPVPEPAWPPGTRLTEWAPDVAARFHTVYDAAFRERLGYPGWPAADWIAAVREDDTFRAEWSLLAELDGLGDAGLVTAGLGWIDQVGVVPAARGRGLGGALVLAALGRMQAAGETEAWLNVNVDNPARRLYERLGFRGRGRRARFAAAAD
jgi:mycothiol synthase